MIFFLFFIEGMLWILIGFFLKWKGNFKVVIFYCRILKSKWLLKIYRRSNSFWFILKFFSDL